MNQFKKVSTKSIRYFTLALSALALSPVVHATALVVTSENPQVNQGLLLKADTNSPLTISSGGYVSDAGVALSVQHTNPIVSPTVVAVNETVAVTVSQSAASVALQSGASSVATITGNLGDATISTTLNIGIEKGIVVQSNGGVATIAGNSSALGTEGQNIALISNAGTLQNVGQGSVIRPGTKSGSWSVTNQSTGIINGGTNSSAIDFSQSPVNITSLDNQGTINAGTGQTAISSTAKVITAFSNSGTITGKIGVNLTGQATNFTSSGTITAGSVTDNAVMMGTGSLLIKGGAVTGVLLGGGNKVDFDLGTGKTFSTNGALNNFTNVNILSGTMILNNNITTAGALTISDNAGLRLSSAVTINNNVVLNDLSTLTVDIGSSSFGKITATAGTVTLNSAKILINNTTTGLLPTNSSYMVVSAPGGVNKVNPTITPILPSVLYTYTGIVNANDVTISITRSRLDSIVTTNTRGRIVATALENNITNVQADAGLQLVLAEISRMSNAADIGNALAQMLPRNDNAARFGVTQSFNKIMQTIENRIQRPKLAGTQFENSYNAGDRPRDQSIWGEIYFGKSEQFARLLTPGYEGKMLGTLFGYDVPLTEVSRVGLALGYGRYFTKSKTFPKNDMNISNWSATVYNTIDFNCMYVDSMLSLAQNTYNSLRKIQIGAMNLVALNQHHGRTFTAKLGVGRVLPEWIRGYDAMPFASILYSAISENGYVERGAPGLNIAMDSKKSNVLEARVGGKVTYSYRSYLGHLTPDFHLSLGYDFMTKGSNFTSTLLPSATSFTIYGVKPAPMDISWGLGLAIRTPHHVDFLLNYDGTWRDNFLASSGQVRAIYRF